MNYSIDIEGMHCLGCSNLIKLSLEELDFEKVVVEQSKNIASFKTTKDLPAVAKLLDTIFSQDLETYKYSNLYIIK